MKKISMLKKLLLLLLLPITLFAAGPLDDLYDFFPKSSQLQGGNKKWLYTSITEKRNDDYVVLSSTYTYYNEQNEKILGINRNTNFIVDIAIYFAKNPTVAKSLYNKNLQESKLPVRREVDFGEESTVSIKPISLKDFKAEYNILILNKNFLISIKTDDGFALMEFADYFDKIVKNYMLANIDRFFLDRFKIKLSYNDNKLSEEIVSTNTDVSTIIIKGKVIDSKGKPVFNAKLSLLGYGYETTTDEKGEYRFEIKTNTKNKKYIEFTKNFILTSQEVKQETLPLVAKIEIKQAHKTENAIVRIDSDKLTGTLISGNRINKLTNIKYYNNTLSFVRDCSPKGSTFKCNQKIEFIIVNNKITGTVIGFGGKGTIDGKIYSQIKEKAYFVKDKLLIEKIETDKSLNVKHIEKNNLVIKNTNDIKQFIHFTLKDYTPSPLDISYELKLTKLPGLMSQKSAPLYLFEGEIKDNKLILNKKNEIIIKNTEQPVGYSFKIDSPEKEYFIGFLPEYSFKESILFSFETAIDTLAPKLIVKSFGDESSEQKIDFTIQKSDKDFASTTKEIKGDKKPDTLLKLKGVKGGITDIEISLIGKFKYYWSTMPNKILPVPVVLLKGKVVNSQNGLFNVIVSENDELLIYLGYPSWVSFDNSLINITLTIDGKKVELSKKITTLE
ncbi:carboxypeptidase regulatory-like domain-containing protein [Deferribacteraceae bacterium V6Fe1]|nr:carboxypeptidase regulatory-like domain-containing protein [Deferribacteraceae bacterium V6Fe1]